jgi:hypothetical protein
MKQLQYIASISLLAALTGLSPVTAADAGGTSDGGRYNQISDSSGAAHAINCHPSKWTR